MERWNRTLAERFFGHQYAQEMCLPSGQRSTEWVARLPGIVAALNGEVTRLTGKKTSDAIKAKTEAQKPSSAVPGRPVSLEEQKVPSGVGVCYLYQPGELEDSRRRATDPVWSLEVYRLGRSASAGWGSQALSAAAPLFRLHSRQVSRTLSRMWPTVLSSRLTLNCWVSLTPKPIGARHCLRHSDCPGPPSGPGCDQPSG